MGDCTATLKIKISMENSVVLGISIGVDSIRRCHDVVVSGIVQGSHYSTYPFFASMLE
jgi:hypothetical protein